jgi:hypothetical protein
VSDSVTDGDRQHHRPGATLIDRHRPGATLIDRHRPGATLIDRERQCHRR